MRVQELFDLTGKVAIVTGGATGLGRQIADALAECGADIVVCARNAERCEAAAAELERLGVRALGLGCDVRDPDSDRGGRAAAPSRRSGASTSSSTTRGRRGAPRPRTCRSPAGRR